MLQLTSRDTQTGRWTPKLRPADRSELDEIYTGIQATFAGMRELEAGALGTEWPLQGDSRCFVDPDFDEVA